MKDLLISKPMRFFFFVSSIIMWIGIYLSGFSNIHWLLYIPAALFIFAAATGICPGMIFSKLLFKEANKK